MIEALLDRLRRAFLAGRGRPAAALILVWLLLLDLYSDSEGWARFRESAPGRIAETLAAPFRGARQSLFDGYQRLHPRQPQANPVLIVAIDEASLKQVGQWPWPRNRSAELIAAIARARPAAIGLDIYFPEADQTSPARVADNLPPGNAALARALRRLPSHEEVLAKALRSARTVLGAAGFDFPTLSTSSGLRSRPIEVGGPGEPLRHVRAYPWVLASLPELQSAASGQAVLSVAAQDGVVRRLPLLMAVNGQLVPGLALEMLRVASGAPIRVQVGAAGVESAAVADLTVPTQAGGEVWLHFARLGSGLVRYVSAADVLAGKVAGELLAGRLVLVGLTGSGLADQRITALGEMVPGIEIQAQTIESLFDGRMLLRPGWIKGLELLLVAALGGGLIWFVPRPGSRLAQLVQTAPRVPMWLVLALGLVIAAGGDALFVARGLLFDAAAPVLILSSVMSSLISSALIEVSQRNAELEQERQHLREAAARAAGEQAAARRNQLGSLPQAAQAFPGERRFELVALLEPAKDVGGDLYDFFMIDQGRLGFVIGDVSGKGLPASLFMAATKTLTKTLAKYLDAGPARVAELANVELAGFNPEALFVTALVGVLDVERGLLTLVNAGHDAPWLVGGEGDVRQLACPPEAGGPPLCMLEDFPYAAQQVALQPGERLVMYTDGVTEAMNAAGELYGSQRLAAALAGHGGATAGELLGELRADLGRHVGGAEASDDLTLMVIRWTPQVQAAVTS